jgi:hypothetical protein
MSNHLCSAVQYIYRPISHPLQRNREDFSLLRTVRGSVGRVVASLSPGRLACAGMVLRIAGMSAIVKIQFVGLYEVEPTSPISRYSGLYCRLQ